MLTITLPRLISVKDRERATNFVRNIVDKSEYDGFFEVKFGKHLQIEADENELPIGAEKLFLKISESLAHFNLSVSKVHIQEQVSDE